MFKKHATCDVLEVFSREDVKFKEMEEDLFEIPEKDGMVYARVRAIASKINNNFDGFEREELKKAYRSFIGKPIFVEHQNSSPEFARGIIIDSAFHDDQPDAWIELLLEVDGEAYPLLAEGLKKGRISKVSMGTNVAYSVCSVCGNEARSEREYCEHIKNKGRTYKNKEGKEVLAYEINRGLDFFEISFVISPAEEWADVLAVYGEQEPNKLKKIASNVRKPKESVQCWNDRTGHTAMRKMAKKEESVMDVEIVRINEVITPKIAQITDVVEPDTKEELPDVEQKTKEEAEAQAQDEKKEMEKKLEIAFKDLSDDGRQKVLDYFGIEDLEEIRFSLSTDKKMTREAQALPEDKDDVSIPAAPETVETPDGEEVDRKDLEPIDKKEEQTLDTFLDRLQGLIDEFKNKEEEPEEEELPPPEEISEEIPEAPPEEENPEEVMADNSFTRTIMAKRLVRELIKREALDPDSELEKEAEFAQMDEEQLQTRLEMLETIPFEEKTVEAKVEKKRVPMLRKSLAMDRGPITTKEEEINTSQLFM